MRSTLALGVRACCVAIFVLLASAPAAEQKSSLVGTSREQVLKRLGDPRSVMAAGGREIFFYPRERVILRNGVVIDVEPVAAAPERKAPLASPAGTPAPTPAAPEPAPAAAAAAPAATARAAAPAKSEPAPSPVTPAAAPAAEPAADAPRPAETTAAAAREPEVSIKLVRPPTGAYVRPPLAKKETPKPPATSEPAADMSTAIAAAPAVDPRANMPARQPAPVERPAAPPVSAESTSAAIAASAPAVVAPPEPVPDVATAPAVEEPLTKPAARKAPASKKRAVARPAEVPEPEADIVTPRTYVIGGLVAAAVMYLGWRWRQRQIELVATAVSRTPFPGAAPASSGNGDRLTADQLSKLNQKHFEELVASYYGKTGVVATRTESPGPVHIKISWKGESRPFALVQCIAQPQGLVDAPPLHELSAVLDTEDIRRGYVVTSGKFNVAARDFAEEKHLTLMSGDILLEKMNALPDSARAELIQQIAAGDVPAAT